MLCLSCHLRIVAIKGVDVGVAEGVADHFHSHLPSFWWGHLSKAELTQICPTKIWLRWVTQNDSDVSNVNLTQISDSEWLECVWQKSDDYLDVGDIKGLLGLPGNCSLAGDSLSLCGLKQTNGHSVAIDRILRWYINGTLPQRLSSWPCSSFWSRFDWGGGGWKCYQAFSQSVKPCCLF